MPTTFAEFSDIVLFLSSLFILFGSIYLTFRLRFVQLSLFPALLRIIREHKPEQQASTNDFTIPPHRALFTAMSTTIGLGTIVGPIFAIHWGGPGALLGFLLTSFFGSAATYTEVGLSLKYRKKLPSGQILGGPMQYLSVLISPGAARWYAGVGALLMAFWSASQANQLAAILDSPLLGDYRTPHYISGGVICIVLLSILFGGITRVAAFSAKLVPTMFVLYMGALLWILMLNMDRIGAVLSLIVTSALSPYAMATGGAVGGIVSAMRWGVFKGTQVTEAGVGTQTIPHSMAETNDPEAQALLSMVSTYTAGIIAFLSGVVALLTDTWQDPSLPVGISMVAASFQMYFSHFGIIIVGINTILFAFGTILGNSYNGSQCFGYISNNKFTRTYYVLSAGIIFIGAVCDTKHIWSHIDIGLACLIIPHMFALLRYAFKGEHARVAAVSA